MEVGEAVVIEEPVLQDFVGRCGVGAADDILQELEDILAERLDEVEVVLLLRVQPLELEICLHMCKLGDWVCYPG